jgi:hypothetical protein
LGILTRHGVNISNISEFMAQFKLWKYNHWEGFLTDLGVDIFEFLKKLIQNNQWNDFMHKVETKIETKLPAHLQALSDNAKLRMIAANVRRG